MLKHLQNGVFRSDLYTVEHLYIGHLWGQKKVVVVERLKQDSILGLSAENVAVVEMWPLVEVRLYFGLFVCFFFFYVIPLARR